MNQKSADKQKRFDKLMWFIIALVYAIVFAVIIIFCASIN
jgi:hypothetical protein